MLARTHGFRHRAAAAAGLVFVGGTTAFGRGDTYTSVSLTSLTGGIGSAPIAGDIVIVVHGCVGTGDVDPSISGYTELTELYANDTVDANVAVAYKVMTVTPDTSVTVFQDGSSSNGHATAIHVWRGVNATPIDVTTTTASGTNDDNVDSPTITPVTAGAVVLTVGLGAQDDELAAALTAPSGYTDNDFVASGRGTQRSAHAVIASKVWSGSGAEDPGAWGGGEADADNSWVAATVVLRPA